MIKIVQMFRSLPVLSVWIPSFQPFAFNNWIIYYNKNVLLLFFPYCACEFAEKRFANCTRGKNDSDEWIDASSEKKRHRDKEEALWLLSESNETERNREETHQQTVANKSNIKKKANKKQLTTFWYFVCCTMELLCECVLALFLPCSLLVHLVVLYFFIRIFTGRFVDFSFIRDSLQSTI